MHFSLSKYCRLSPESFESLLELIVSLSQNKLLVFKNQSLLKCGLQYR